MRFGLAAVLAVAVWLPAAAAASDNSSLATVRAGTLAASGKSSLATVAVPVANVWESPGAATLTNDHRAWPTAAITVDQRRALVGNMPTQALFGERVLVLERQGAWTKIAVPDQPSPLDPRGYPGWVESWQLRPALPAAKTVMVTVPKAKLSNGREVSFATELPVIQGGPQSFLVRTPTGVVARLPALAARPLPRTRADLVRSAKQFLGLRYLWGGLSAWGYDCSGLTWAVYRAHGITIPRDADAQFTAGREVSLEDAKPGDLIFYGTSFVHHVTMVIGKGLMIEAPNSASEVRIVPVRTDDFAGVRSFLGGY